MNKPSCYGEMDWVLKYPEDEIPKTSICACEFTNSCLRLTNNKRQQPDEGDNLLQEANE